jgi:acyl-CoA dehydrogenase
MDFAIDAELRARLEEAREWGATEVRPAGLESDRMGKPLPPEHPYFGKALAHGEGRTRWPGPGAPPRKPPRGAVVAGLLLAEELAYWDRGIGVANPGPGLPEAAVLAQGSDAQKQRFLGPFLEPDRPRWACFAMTEPGAGSDAAAIRTTARRDGSHYVLDGAKCFIGNASRADWILVQATLDPSRGREAQRAFFVEQGTPGLGGFKIEKKMGLKAYESTSFTLERCRVPAENLLGGEERLERKRHAEGSATLGAFEQTRPMVAAQALGIARAALEFATSYACGREAFGGPIMDNQGISFPLADLATELDAARLLTWRASWMAAQRVAYQRAEGSMAKLRASEVAQRIVERAVQTCGGWGYIADLPVEKWYRDAKLYTIFEGTSEIQRVVIGRALAEAAGEPPLHHREPNSTLALGRTLGRGTPARSRAGMAGLKMANRAPRPVLKLAMTVLKPPQRAPRAPSSRP